MKNNYILKTIKTSIAIFAFLVGFAQLNAQTTNINVVITGGVPDVLDEGETYQTLTTDQVITMTGTATVDGVGTFDVSFDVTPKAGQRVVRSATQWGVNPEFVDVDVDGVVTPTATNDGPLFRARANGQSFATIGNITFSNYTGGLTVSNITSHTFTEASIAAGINRFDRFAYKVGEIEYAFTSKLGANPTAINLLTAGPVDIAGGTALTSLDTFVIKSVEGRSANSDAWAVQSITVNLDIDYTSLSTNAINKNDTKLSIFPTVVESTFSVNKAFKTLKLFDLTGKTVKTFNSSDALEVSGLNQGLYIVKIQSATGGISTSKMIVK